jgi:hypothetical protein
MGLIWDSNQYWQGPDNQQGKQFRRQCLDVESGSGGQSLIRRSNGTALVLAVSQELSQALNTLSKRQLQILNVIEHHRHLALQDESCILRFSRQREDAA